MCSCFIHLILGGVCGFRRSLWMAMSSGSHDILTSSFPTVYFNFFLASLAGAGQWGEVRAGSLAPVPGVGGGRSACPCSMWPNRKEVLSCCVCRESFPWIAAHFVKCIFCLCWGDHSTLLLHSVSAVTPTLISKFDRPCIPGMYLTHSWWVVFFTYCCLFANILLRNFVCMFMRNIGLWFFSCPCKV